MGEWQECDSNWSGWLVELESVERRRGWVEKSLELAHTTNVAPVFIQGRRWVHLSLVLMKWWLLQELRSWCRCGSRQGFRLFCFVSASGDDYMLYWMVLRKLLVSGWLQGLDGKTFFGEQVGWAASESRSGHRDALVWRYVVKENVNIGVGDEACEKMMETSVNATIGKWMIAESRFRKQTAKPTTCDHRPGFSIGAFVIYQLPAFTCLYLLRFFGPVGCLGVMYQVAKFWSRKGIIFDVNCRSSASILQVEQMITSQRFVENSVASRILQIVGNCVILWFRVHIWTMSICLNFMSSSISIM